MSDLSVFVAYNNEHGVVGFSTSRLSRDKKYCHIYEVSSLYLLSQYHNQKIGFKLLVEKFKETLKNGHNSAYLWVLKNNPKIKFYKKTGDFYNNVIKYATIFNKEVEELCYIWNDISNVV